MFSLIFSQIHSIAAAKKIVSLVSPVSTVSFEKCIREA